MIPLALLFLVNCAPDPAAPNLPETEAPTLSLPPDLDSIDFATTYQDALIRAASLDVRGPWAAHAETLQGLEAGCPDVYAGAPDLDSEVGDGGYSWSDRCSRADQTSFGGWMWWSNTLASEGDRADAAGSTVTGQRDLEGDATISTAAADVLFRFNGESHDTLSRVEAPDYLRWTWSSEVLGDASGSLLGEDWRADVYLYAVGDDAGASGVELRGNVYTPGALIAERFDSIAVDLSFATPETTAPEGCALEPSGWIAVRDADAWWYDLVLAPRTTDTSAVADPDEPWSACDGCGTLYVRGLPQTEREVCLDFSFLWDYLITPPEPAEFALSLRDLLPEAP